MTDPLSTCKAIGNESVNVERFTGGMKLDTMVFSCTYALHAMRLLNRVIGRRP